MAGQKPPPFPESPATVTLRVAAEEEEEEEEEDDLKVD